MVVLTAAAAPAAAEVCVSCKGPEATYLCTVKNADTIESLAGDKALKKICSKVLKRTEQHASCQVLDVPAAKCPGVAKTVGWGDVKKAAAAASDDAATKTKSASPPAAPRPVEPKGVARPSGGKSAASPDAPPAVASPSPSNAAVAEPVPQEAPPATDDASVGEKLKGAAEDTWKCVSSFFGNC